MKTSYKILIFILVLGSLPFGFVYLLDYSLMDSFFIIGFSAASGIAVRLWLNFIKLPQRFFNYKFWIHSIGISILFFGFNQILRYAEGDAGNGTLYYIGVVIICLVFGSLAGYVNEMALIRFRRQYPVWMDKKEYAILDSMAYLYPEKVPGILVLTVKNLVFINIQNNERLNYDPKDLHCKIEKWNVFPIGIKIDGHRIIRVSYPRAWVEEIGKLQAGG